MSVSSAEQSSQTRETGFHFVLCEHTIQNAAEVAASLADCDVLAFEAPGMNDRERKAYEIVYSKYAASGTSEDERSQIEKAFEIFVPASEEDSKFIIAVLKNFKASDKHIALIDISEEDTDAYETDQRVEEAQEEYAQRIKNGTTLEVLEGLLKEKLYLEARSIIQRETIVIGQLLHLAGRHPGSKIGVIVGALHTGEYHAIRSSFSADRRFVVPGQDKSKSTKLDYKPEHQAVRELRFAVSQELGDRVLKTVLLHDLIYFGTGISMASSTFSAMGVDDIARRLVEVDSVRKKGGIKALADM